MTDYAKVSDVKVGDTVVTDGGFTCMKQNERHIVQEDENGLFIPCEEGHHYIDGQLDDGDVYIGLRKE